MKHPDIYSATILAAFIHEIGFLPLLDSGIRGYSAEDVVDEDCRYVVFPDGTVIWHKQAIDTFIATLQHIGLERIPQVGIVHGDGYNLVSKDKRPPQPGRVWQHEVDGWYIYSNISNRDKIKDLKLISKFFKLGLKIEEGKPDIKR
ncbi:MAG: hypothetical protein HUK06_08335 [Bacteroidaceae bacterium]|nr:hypothetical protein [Bacteroidaceae bacterium]